MNEWNAWCAEQMNKLPEVRWDRCTVRDPGYVASAFGWIDRPDGRSDFVLVFFGERFGFVTSSAEYTREISKRLLGTDEGHRDCQRIEDVMGDLVGNKCQSRRVIKPGDLTAALEDIATLARTAPEGGHGSAEDVVSEMGRLAREALEERRAS